MASLLPRLAGGGAKRTTTGSKNADEECRRRSEERALFGELSRYYPPKEGKKAWARRPLLAKGKHMCDHSVQSLTRILFSVEGPRDLLGSLRAVPRVTLSFDGGG